jgi:hypothetical protein
MEAKVIDKIQANIWLLDLTTVILKKLNDSNFKHVDIVATGPNINYVVG